MLIAQALGEYAGMSTLRTAFAEHFNTLESTVRQTDAHTWALIVIGGAILWMLLSGRQR